VYGQKNHTTADAGNSDEIIHKIHTKKEVTKNEGMHPKGFPSLAMPILIIVPGTDTATIKMIGIRYVPNEKNKYITATAKVYDPTARQAASAVMKDEI
jgi:hypothetical protein